MSTTDRPFSLAGIRVVEIADERGEYVGLMLASLGAEVVKVEPPGGERTRRIGPYLDDVPDPERSLHFWAYNRGKHSVVLDARATTDRQTLIDLIGSADVLLDATDTPIPGLLGLEQAALLERFPDLIHARCTDFGDSGPWAAFKGSDLVHLALGGPVMNCGYDPEPDGRYDLPPVAPQLWHSYSIAGEQLVMAIVAALVYRDRGGGGQYLSCAIHEAVAKNTELDLMNWVMRRAPLHRQTARHAAEVGSIAPTIVQTKDGRWFNMSLLGVADHERLREFLERYGVPNEIETAPGAVGTGRSIPGSGGDPAAAARASDALGRLARKFTYERFPWREAQEAGLIITPLRKPHENATDEHWLARGTFAAIEHPDLQRRFDYPVRKWISTATDWQVGDCAPRVGQHDASILGGARSATPARVVVVPADPPRPSPRGKPLPLDGIRILDFTWFLASAGATRFLAALGAECLKVEWKGNPDTRVGAMAPVGGRAARAIATEPLQGVTDSDMGGQFNNKNAGKRGISLNVRDPRGLELARRLTAISDVVAEGFSPGVMERWGLGYDALRSIRPEVIYAQQSGMGTLGTYGKLRAVGPAAAALAGTSEMSGFAEPSLPAGWGYSYLDWVGAYSFASAILAAIYHRDRTGEGQWIDASQCESGMFLTAVPVLDWSANGRTWGRVSNRSPYKPAAPHGIYRAAGVDRWVAIACFTEVEWTALAGLIDEPWTRSPSFESLSGRLANHDELDRELDRWTSAHDPYQLMYELQALGVPAGVCQTAEDRCDNDPQLQHFEWLTEVTGTKIGRWPVAEMPVKMSETPPYIGGYVDRGAPIYGEDNDYVFGELLGLSSADRASLVEDGVI